MPFSVADRGLEYVFFTDFIDKIQGIFEFICKKDFFEVLIRAKDAILRGVLHRVLMIKIILLRIKNYFSDVEKKVNLGKIRNSSAFPGTLHHPLF